MIAALSSDRYSQYEELRELGYATKEHGAFELGAVLLELAELVLLGREAAALRSLRRVPDREEA